MNVTLSHTLMIPNGEVYKIMDSQGLVLWKKERKYTISFNANGGTGTMADQEFTFGELKALPTNTFTKSGSKFYGWSLTPDGMVQYADGQSIVGIGNGIDTVVLYAVWAMALNTKYTYTSNNTFVVPMTGMYSIEMHGGGGGGSGASYADGWSSGGKDKYENPSGASGGGSGEIYNVELIKGDSYAITIGTGGSAGINNGDSESKKLTSSVSYTVHIGTNGSKGGTTKFGSLLSVEGGGGATGSSCSMHGVSSSSTGTAIGSLASGSSGGATTGSYGNGGSGGSYSVSTFGGNIIDKTSKAPKKGQDGAVIVTLIDYLPYTVVFNVNGGTGTMDNQSFNINETKALSTNTLSKSGYTFIGWSTSADGDVVYADGESVTNIANSGETITLYAVWDLILAVGTTYTFTSNGTFTVPKTGSYSIEMHGGGGGGGGAWNGIAVGASVNRAGGYGGGSGEIYTATLKKGTSYAITIGAGGSGGAKKTTSGGDGTDGGTTTFGSLYSIAGGYGGEGGSRKSSGSDGQCVGSLAQNANEGYDTYYRGGSTTGTYGNGGSANSTSSGKAGTNGAVFVKYLG